MGSLVKNGILILIIILVIVFSMQLCTSKVSEEKVESADTFSDTYVADSDDKLTTTRRAVTSTVATTTTSTTTTTTMFKYAVLETSMGDIDMLLIYEYAPISAAHFEKLATQGYYNNNIFHRIVQGFIIQSGDPTGTGNGNPGYYIEDEFKTGLQHNVPGVVAFANAGPGTTGSQFYITMKAESGLDEKYAIFAWVRGDGMDIVRAINNVPLDGYKPVDDVIIKNVRLYESSEFH